MKILGLDIGTTTVSAVVMGGGAVLDSLTRNNASFLPSPNPWEKIQDPGLILKTALCAVECLLERHPDIGRIGVTGQMHGIVYLDPSGHAVSPLYTWQDGRGDLPWDSRESYAAHLSRLSGYPLSTGYGLVTHFYNLRNGLVPDAAATFCTIHDYIAMILAGNSRPYMDASDAASLGLFDVARGRFDETALKKARIDPALLPALAEEPCIGCFRGRIPVYAAIGDNQASFLGAVEGALDSVLVNVGTGGQISVHTEEYLVCPGLETRPFPGGGYLLVGASLCGGRAYALLERFIRETAAAVTGAAPESCYDAMDRLLSSGEKPEDLPLVSPLFQGTREDPAQRGSITELSTENFTLRHLLWATLEGMTQELYGMYQKYHARGAQPGALIGSGNGLRRNRHLQNCFTQTFGQTLQLSRHTEEAAAGAAIYAGTQQPERE